MKWIKRAVVLTASLLVLLAGVQARELVKARAGGERNVASSAEELKMPELMVVTPETSEFVLPILPAEEPKKPILPVLPLEKEPEEEVIFQPEPEETPALAETPEAIEPVETQPAEPAGTSGPRFPEGEDWQLLLVNPWNEMPEDYEVDLVSLSNGLKIDRKAYDALSNMLGDCKDAGLNPLVISAYRTQAKQTSLYKNRIARFQAQGYSKEAAVKAAGRWVARPGTSEHQLGLAVDIVSASNQSLTKAQEKTKVQQWLMEHCWEYGFILRYPNDKSDITGIGYEPWHYRYVGVEIAQDVRESGLCFEEYLLLREETLAAKTPA